MSFTVSLMNLMHPYNESSFKWQKKKLTDIKFGIVVNYTQI